MRENHAQFYSQHSVTLLVYLWCYISNSGGWWL